MATNQRNIRYINKHTSANTNYREVSEEDMAFIQQELIRWLAVMSELDMARDEDSRWVRDHWWHKRTDTLPKGREGQNTPASFIGGLVNNMVFGTQRDLTDKQMDAIQNIGFAIAPAFEGCSVITFQIGFSRG